MASLTRREFLQTSVAAAAATFGSTLFPTHTPAAGLPTEVPPGQRPAQDKSVEILHPRARVPLGFIIDDSTCLVNMAYFCMPQFNAALPTRPDYWKKWKTWPREIPDSFVREFGEFAAEQGVRGKYSLVPYPACVGWLDRELPGWSRKELKESLKLVRDLIAPNFDITPEMITHTRVIDIKTGRPVEPIGPNTIENAYPPVKKSADELAAYIAYALKILKNCDIACGAITTPGGFGNKCRAELSQAVREAVTAVYATEIPHYFKYIIEDDEPTHPRLEHVENLETDHPRLVVNVPAGIGDNFGGWDGDRPPQPDKYATEDASAGRLIDLIERNQPAVMFGHWAGLYTHGTKKGLEAAKRVILSLNRRYRDTTIWMKTGELARYQAAKELTRIERTGNTLTLTAPFACPDFTLRIPRAGNQPPRLTHDDGTAAFAEVNDPRDVKPGTWLPQNAANILCINLPKGRTLLAID